MISGTFFFGLLNRLTFAGSAPMRLYVPEMADPEGEQDIRERRDALLEMMQTHPGFCEAGEAHDQAARYFSHRV